MRLSSTTLAVAVLWLASFTASAQVWIGGYYCWDREVEAELVHRVTIEMGIPQAAGDVHVFCVSHMPSSIGERTYQEIGFWTGVSCTTQYWTYLIGCINGAAQRIGTSGGWVAVLRVHPAVMDKYIAIAKRYGMSSGSRTWADTRCIWTLERLMRVLVHELHHVWFGLRDGTATMAAADRAMQDRVMTKHGAWIRLNDWVCAMNRIYTPRTPEAITEYIKP